MFNFLFSSLCVPCRHGSDRVRVSNGSVGNGPRTSTIKLDELFAPRKRQERGAWRDKVFHSARYMDTAQVSSSNFDRIGPFVRHCIPRIAALLMMSDKMYSMCQQGKAVTGVGSLYFNLVCNYISPVHSLTFMHTLTHI